MTQWTKVEPKQGTSNIRKALELARQAAAEVKRYAEDLKKKAEESSG